MDDQKLLKYKTKMCSVARQSGMPICNFGPQCIFAHNDTELRRDLSVHYYVGEMCPRILAGEYCPNVNCIYAHKDIELLYHPDHYKTQLCVQAQQLGGCEKKQVCCFAHGQHELRQPIQRSTQLLQQHLQQQSTNPQHSLSPISSIPTSDQIPLFSQQASKAFNQNQMNQGQMTPSVNFYGLSKSPNPKANGFSDSVFPSSAATPGIGAGESLFSNQADMDNHQSPMMRPQGNPNETLSPNLTASPSQHRAAQAQDEINLGPAVALATQLANTVYSRSHPNSTLNSFSELNQNEFSEIIGLLKQQITICADSIGWLNFERAQSISQMNDKMRKASVMSRAPFNLQLDMGNLSLNQPANEHTTTLQ